MSVLSNVRRSEPTTAGGFVAALECPTGTEYDEASFLYFMTVERARAERSNRPLRVLLTTVENEPGKPGPMGRAMAARLFAGLRRCLRETDIIGWYRQDRVAGVVLSERADASAGAISGRIEQRVGDVLRRQLPVAVARSVRLRLVQLQR